MSTTISQPEAGAPDNDLDQVLDLFCRVRARSLELSRHLSPEDQTIQSMDDASPTKWHLAHTTWFFETFLLKKFDPNYRVFDPAYHFLFNSYYEAEGPRHPRPRRGLLSRPGHGEVTAYREHVDANLGALIEKGRLDTADIQDFTDLLELGCHHEQQHQELILTDIKHALAANPTSPAYDPHLPDPTAAAPDLKWLEFGGGLVEIGQDGDGFCFDNELPRHKSWVDPFKIASRLITNREYLDFIAASGYQQAEYWLSDGWRTVQQQGWVAPEYWRKMEGSWQIFTLGGLREINPDAPVCHVSFYEAMAYASWAGKRLAREAEWETAAGDIPPIGNLLASGNLHPVPGQPADDCQMTPLQMYGDTWEWTQSPYTPYPGFVAAPGAVGEYNGKFMANQLVLKGGSCVTPPGHIRASYRNFFYPHQRWQFSGIRLAVDV